MQVLIRHEPGVRGYARPILVAIAIVGAGIALLVYIALPIIGRDWIGGDYRVYQEAARRWLAGGAFYPAYQLTGPFQFNPQVVLVPPPLLEPPLMLALFVPSLALPAILWWAIPIGTIAATVIYWRPKVWALAIIPWLLIYQPTIGTVAAGNPSMWLAAALALATRWRAFSALLFLKPTLAPFALFGIRHRQWWMAVALLALASLPFLPMDLDWIRSMLNARGAGGVLHSLDHVPLLSIPLLAWFARSRPAAASMAVETDSVTR
jgi:hypothetical protein